MAGFGPLFLKLSKAIADAFRIPAHAASKGEIIMKI